MKINAVLADGHIRCSGLTGSIHSVAKSLSGGAPANGWDLWFFETDTGSRAPIDRLREKIRVETDTGESS